MVVISLTEKLDSADEEIVRGIELLGTQLINYTRNLDLLKKERDGYAKNITDLEKKASTVETELNEVKANILLVRGEVDQYRAVVITAIIENNKKNIKSLEQDIEEMRTKRFSSLSQNPYVQALLPIIADKNPGSSLVELLSQCEPQKENALSLSEHPGHESPIEIYDLLGLGQVQVGGDIGAITTGLNTAFSEIIYGLKKVSDYYAAKDKTIKEMEKLTEKNSEYLRNIGEEDLLLASAQEEIKPHILRYNERKSYLTKLTEKEDSLKAKIEEYNKQIDYNKELLKESMAKREKLNEDFLSGSIKSMLSTNVGDNKKETKFVKKK